jgi:nucleoside-diphosphate-sugar epimerase
VTDGLSYAGKRVILVGAASEVGAAATAVLVELGAEVHAIDRQKPAASGLASFTECDVRDPAQLDRAFDRIGRVVNMVFECTGLPGDERSRLVDAAVPKLLEDADSAITCVAAASDASLLASAAAALAPVAIRVNGVVLEGFDAEVVATALVLLGSPRAGGVTGTCLVPAAVLPRAD